MEFPTNDARVANSKPGLDLAAADATAPVVNPRLNPMSASRSEIEGTRDFPSRSTTWLHVWNFWGEQATLASAQRSHSAPVHFESPCDGTGDED